MSDDKTDHKVTPDHFQKIIKEGKIIRNKRAWKKCKTDALGIQKRNSKSGINPLEQFPKEIWEKIFNDLKSPKDLSHTYEVHDVFREVLQERRIRDILLPQTLGLKFDHFWKKPAEHEPKRRAGQRPKKIEKRTLARCATLRGVSKSLRDSIDCWYAGEIDKNIRSENEADIPVLACVFMNDQEGTEAKLNGIINNFSSGEVTNRAKRFFLRSLKVKFNYSDYYQGEQSFEDAFTKFKSKVTSLLDVIGDQVWLFDYDVAELSILEEEGVTFSNIYVMLKEWAILMPNLKWIVLNIGSYCDISPYLAIPIEREVYENHPFPRLEHLQRVCFMCNSESRYYSNILEMLSAVLGANSHIKGLSISPGIEEEENEKWFKLLQSRFQNLPLDLEVFSAGGTESSDSCKLRFYEQILNFNWQLKRMQLSFNASDTPLKTVFQLVERFPTLEHLFLSLVDVEFDNDIPYLMLPNLTHLELTLSYEGMKFNVGTNFFFSLQFLLYVRKLKKLNWNNQSYEVPSWKLRRFLINNERHEEMINFRGGIRDLRSSNIWDVFPDLEEVEVDIIRNYGASIRKYRRSERL